MSGSRKIVSTQRDNAKRRGNSRKSRRRRLVVRPSDQNAPDHLTERMRQILAMLQPIQKTKGNRLRVENGERNGQP
jgi:hypothetical protein